MNTGLFYTKTSYSQPTTKTVELRIPKHWGMFTSQGNKSLETKAAKLVDKLKTTSSTIDKLKLFANYFKSWRKMSSGKNTGEAGDTDVREQVWGFAVEAGKCFQIDESTLDQIWESPDAYPKRKGQ